MPENNNDPLQPINSLCGHEAKKFFIPGYQRGYRWTARQVEDLLNDIREFMGKDTPGNEFYCLQPLVVKEMTSDDARLDRFKPTERKGWYEVIDGQQRLTTIKIILTYLVTSAQDINTYSIEYETRIATKNTEYRIGSKEFLDKIGKENINDTPIDEVAQGNIDFFHMHQAWITTTTWFKGFTEQKRENFKTTLLDRVKFIWYEIPEGEDPVEVFTRLNIGKISLTNAELIKALFLNRSNWTKQSEVALALSQLEVASQWDNIEYTLQNDEFWMFFHDETAPATRIDYIFDYICSKDLLKIGNSSDKIGNDRYRTFRYFYNYFKSQNDQEYDKIKKCWDKVKEIFGTLLEWYNDCEMYHYIGFIAAEKDQKEIDALLAAWLDCENSDKGSYQDFLNSHTEKSRSKKTFCEWLKERIKSKISNCNDLTTQYEISCHPKTGCRPLLLLFNIQTVIDQNKGYKGNQQYRLGVFYKFPFHLYKREKWDIEHIDANTENELVSFNDQREWVLNALYALYNSTTVGDSKRKQQDALIKIFFDDIPALKNSVMFAKKIQTFLNEDGTRQSNFDEICVELRKLLGGNAAFPWKDEGKEKNQIWNFALLDRGTNRGYHNDLFPTKRRKLIDKDQGKQTTLKWIPETCEIRVEITDAGIAFVPPCTLKAFLKYYTPGNNDMWKWNELDAKNYQQAIADTLEVFGVTIGKNAQEK